MDHLHDTNLLLFSGTELPGFLKIANESPKFFAYSNGMDHFFPIDTPSNAWLSAAYFEKNASTNLSKDEFITTHDRILEALELHNVKYESPFTVEKIASTNEYTFEKLASEVRVFEQNYHSIKPEERHEKAKAIMDRYSSLKDSGAEVHGSLPKIVEDYAGENLREDWPSVIKERASKTNVKEEKEAYNELSSKTDLTKEIILRLLGMLDKKSGLDSYYDNGIEDPYRSLLTTKVPEQKKVIIMVVNGKDYDHEKLASLDPSKLSDQFGGEILAGLTDNRDVYLKSAPAFVKEAVARELDSI